MKDRMRESLEILELTPEATYPEINQAYQRLKNIYSSESTLITPVTRDFSKRKKNDILRKIEKAHSFLTANFQALQTTEGGQQTKSPRTEDARKRMGKKISFTGRNLKKIRTALGLSLSDISMETKIRIELLKDIENENFKSLPDEIYLRAHVRHLAKLLGLHPAKASEDYLDRYRSSRESEKAGPKKKRR